VARAYVDQLRRGNGLAARRLTAVSTELDRVEGLSGDQQRAALTALATQLDADAAGARDAARVRMLAGAVRDLTNRR
jgi:hypothetical protein